MRDGLSSVHVPVMSKSMYSSGPPALIPGGGAQEPLLPHTAGSSTVTSSNDNQKP